MNIYILLLYDYIINLSSSNVYICKNSTEKIDCSCEHPKIDTARGF